MRCWKRCLSVLLILVLLVMPAAPASAASYKNTHVNTGDQRVDIIGVALTQLGYTEGRNNANKYGSWYRLNYEPWCAIFVCWCARQANIPTSILRNTAVAAPNASMAYMDKHFGIDYFDGEEYTPLPGDLFFTKDFSHVGLVAAVSGQWFFTVEGNSNVAGSSNGDRVVCNRRLIEDFYFGVPEYVCDPPTQPEATEPTESEVTEPTDPEVTEPIDPEVTEPTDSEVTEPTDSEVTEPTDPEVTEPIDPEVTEPTDSEVTEPTDPEVTEPTDPEVTEPTDPEVTEPTDSEVTEPTDPEVTEPTDPEVTEPTDPEVTEPTDPEVTEPTDPEVTEPTDLEVTEPTATLATVSPISTDRTHYRQGENSQGDTVVFSWQNDPTDVQRYFRIYKGDEIVNIQLDESITSYTLTDALAGGYLAVLSVTKADGSTYYSTCPVIVEDPYMLHIRYNTGPGQISETMFYRIVADALILRASPSTSASSLRLIEKETVVPVYEIQEIYGELWGKTEFMGSTGYIAIRPTTARRAGCFTDETGLIYSYPEEDPVQTRWEYAKGSEDGLADPDQLGLVLEHHSFAGWSAQSDGTGRRFAHDDSSLTTLELMPSFRYEDQILMLYAQWEKNVSSMQVATPPAKTDYYTGEALEITGLILDVTYTDGTQETVSEGFCVNGFSSVSPGPVTVDICYHNACISLELTVLNRLLYTQTDDTVTVDGYVGATGELLLPASTAGKPITAISPEAFRDNTQLTGILIPQGVTAIGENAFAGCTGLTDVYFTGTREQWDAIAIAAGNEALTGAQLQTEYRIPGDFDGNRIVNEDDAIYLLRHVLFPETYPAQGFTDLTGDGVTNEDDAIYLLQHVLFPDIYPL